ncbi:hypothetical protein T4C_3482, partial [Trichinella pseudospiralis]
LHKQDSWKYFAQKLPLDRRKLAQVSFKPRKERHTFTLLQLSQYDRFDSFCQRTNKLLTISTLKSEGNNYPTFIDVSDAIIHHSPKVVHYMENKIKEKVHKLIFHWYKCSYI